ALDKEWRFTYVNRNGAEMLRSLQSTPGVLLGRSIWEEFPGSIGTIFEKNYRRAMQEQVSVSFEAVFGPSDQWFEVKAYPSPEGLSAYFREITKQRQAESLLLANAQRLQAMFNQAAVGISIASLEGQLEEVNRRFCEIVGYSENELRGM